MNTKVKFWAVLLLGLVALGLSVPMIMAAAPANDTIGGATSVTIAYSETLDTTEATTDADDAQLNTNCGAPATDASVWYTLEGTGLGVVVDVSASDYTAGVIIGTGTPGALNLVACGPDGVFFFAEAGTTYYILAFDDQGDGGGNGGTLEISITDAPPPPSVDFSVNPRGQFNSKTGTATISGQYTCTSGDFIEVYVDAYQRVGRGYVVGYGGFFDYETCDGQPRAWSAEVFPQFGIFKGGKTLTATISFSCNNFDCASGYVEQTIQLAAKKK